MVELAIYAQQIQELVEYELTSQDYSGLLRIQSPLCHMFS